MTQRIAHPGLGRCPRGYSLMEVMFAMAVLGIGLIAVSSLFPVGLVQQRRAIDDAQGTIHGQNILAQLQVSHASHSAFAGVTGNGFTPVNLTTAGLPPYVDPTNTFDYRLAYRRAAAGSPVEIAIFVYRKSDLALQGEALRSTVAGVVAGTGEIDLPGAAPDIYWNQRNQAVLMTKTDVGPGSPWVLQVVRNSFVANPPQSNIPNNQGQLLYLPQKAIIITTGIVQ